MNSQDKQYSETNFPERLFVLGAGPSLELLYPYREELDSWGHWAIMRSDIVQPFLQFIKPLYTIRYYPRGRQIDKTTGEQYNKAYGISLDRALGDMTNGHGGSIGLFVSQFQKFGGKELLCCGFDGTNEGYWRGQTTWNHQSSYQHNRDCNTMNKTSKEAWGSVKVFHVGATRYNIMTEISIEKIKNDI